MKVTRDEQFTPITITLETREEALWMWYMLDMVSFTVVKYAESGAEKPSSVDVYNHMSERFNAVFKPHGLTSD